MPIQEAEPRIIVNESRQQFESHKSSHSHLGLSALV